MDLNYVSVDKFQALIHNENLIVVGLGSDGWMYQFQGEEGLWKRLSSKFPSTIILATPSLEKVEPVADDKPVEEAPVALPDASTPAPSDTSAPSTGM